MSGLMAALGASKEVLFIELGKGLLEDRVILAYRATYHVTISVGINQYHNERASILTLL